MTHVSLSPRFGNTTTAHPTPIAQTKRLTIYPALTPEGRAEANRVSLMQVLDIMWNGVWDVFKDAKNQDATNAHILPSRDVAGLTLVLGGKQFSAEEARQKYKGALFLNGFMFFREAVAVFYHKLKWLVQSEEGLKNKGLKLLELMDGLNPRGSGQRV